MSWRRFRVLLARGFVIDPQHPLTEAPQMPGITPSVENGFKSMDPRYAKYGGFDWNAALDKAVGRETPTNVVRMSLDQMLKASR